MLREASASLNIYQTNLAIFHSKQEQMCGLKSEKT